MKNARVNRSFMSCGSCWFCMYWLEFVVSISLFHLVRVVSIFVFSHILPSVVLYTLPHYFYNFYNLVVLLSTDTVRTIQFSQSGSYPMRIHGHFRQCREPYSGQGPKMGVFIGSADNINSSQLLQLMPSHAHTGYSNFLTPTSNSSTAKRFCFATAHH